MTVWCPVCCTNHPPTERCPGSLNATGPEDHGQRLSVETTRGIEGYGVLLARSGPMWRARILTYPNVLWTVPGGSATMKFIGPTREAAERRAVDYIRTHCAMRGYRMRDELELAVQTGAHGARPAGAPAANPRCTRILPLRFGVNRPTIFARTGNLSESGLFVNTDQPLGPGASAGMMLELEHCKLPLRGSVIWNRPFPAPAQPAGMGVQLLSPPRTYVRYVHSLL